MRGDGVRQWQDGLHADGWTGRAKPVAARPATSSQCAPLPWGASRVARMGKGAPSTTPSLKRGACNYGGSPCRHQECCCPHIPTRFASGGRLTTRVGRSGPPTCKRHPLYPGLPGEAGSLPLDVTILSTTLALPRDRQMVSHQRRRRPFLFFRKAGGSWPDIR